MPQAPRKRLCSVSVSFFPFWSQERRPLPGSGQEAQHGSPEQGDWQSAGGGLVMLRRLQGWLQEPLSGHTWELPPSAALWGPGEVSEAFTLAPALPLSVFPRFTLQF